MLSCPHTSDDQKKKEQQISSQSSYGQSAFLGPNIWDQTLPSDFGGSGDFLKLEHLDLDEFLSVCIIKRSLTKVFLIYKVYKDYIPM